MNAKPDNGNIGRKVLLKVDGKFQPVDGTLFGYWESDDGRAAAIVALRGHEGKIELDGELVDCYVQPGIATFAVEDVKFIDS